MNLFNKTLLTEMRILAIDFADGEITKRGLSLAMAEKGNLESIGFTFNVESLGRLAMLYSKVEPTTSLVEKVQSVFTDIVALPMYPNFPSQVKEMTEEEFRTDQLIHYISTYGIEMLYDVEVKEGLLPYTENLMERTHDKQLLELKTIELIPVGLAHLTIYDRIINQKERFTTPQVLLAKEVVKNSPHLIEGIPFKENIQTLLYDLLGDKEQRVKLKSILTRVFKHPGDVLDFLEYAIVKNRYRHFNTSTKRMFVELIESFSAYSLSENLSETRFSKAFRGKKASLRSRNRGAALISYLSYSRFTKSEEHYEVVTALFDNELVSWTQLLEQNYASQNYEAVLEMLSERPGVLFRQMNRLKKLGVSSNAILSALDSEKLKTQSIISAINHVEDNEKLIYMMKVALAGNLQGKEIEQLQGKKVFLDLNEYNLENSTIHTNEKYDDGGYVRSGLAYKIPEDVEVVRFFTYWNDNRRIDIDLHSYGRLKNGERIHVGWNSHYNEAGMTTSGDITHSNAAEYIDINLPVAEAAGVVTVSPRINSYTQVPFSNIETVFAGLMAVSKNNDTTKLYDGKNVFFRHDLNMNEVTINYGEINIPERYIRVGEVKEHELSLALYMNLLLEAQNVTIVDKKEEADITITMEKVDDENSLSLLDNNFFM